MNRRPLLMLGALPASLLFGVIATAELRARQKDVADPNDPTVKLFQLLDSSYGGKLGDFYLLADIYPDPKNPGQEVQHVLRVEYDRNLSFGKLKLYVRSVAKMQPDQLKAYTPKMAYEFGVEDSEKFMKAEPGPLGRVGDLYLRSSEDHPLAKAPVTDEARKTYERLLTDYVLPALQKKQP